MKCKECKNENRDGAIYCSKCGCKLPQVQICTNPKCRKPLPFGAGFCPECGTKIIQKAEEPIRLTTQSISKGKNTKEQVRKETKENVGSILEDTTVKDNNKSASTDSSMSTIAGILVFLDLIVLPPVLMIFGEIRSKLLIGIIVIVVAFIIVICDDKYFKDLEYKIKRMFW